MKITLNRTLPKLDIPLLCFVFSRMEARKALLRHSSLLLSYRSNLDLDCFHNRSTKTCGFNLRWALQAPHCSWSVISPILHLSSQGSDQPSSSTPGVPNARAADRYRSVACQEPGRTAGGERWMSEQSFICRAPSFPSARITAQTTSLPQPHGKTVFHKTGPPCQKGWGLLLYTLRRWPCLSSFSRIHAHEGKALCSQMQLIYLEQCLTHSRHLE